MRWLVSVLGGVAALGLLAVVSVRADDQAQVVEGKPAPAVELPATQIESVFPDKKDAKSINLKDFEGKKNVVLYFYPKAMTSGCTKESCAYRDLQKKFAEIDTVIIGISTDKLEAQNEFTTKEKLNFPLFADTDKKVTKAFGSLNETRGMAFRDTFVIDKKGVVRKIYRKVGNAEKHPDEVYTWVKENIK